MKNFVKVVFVLVALNAFLIAEEKEYLTFKAEQAEKKGDYYQAAVFYERALNESQEIKKAEIFFKLALVYLKNQDQEKAFDTFLKSLNAIPSSSQTTLLLKEEENLYTEALSVYLDPSLSFGNNAAAILDKYQKIILEHPDYYHLNYIVAMAYANQKKYEEFFKHFFISYQHLANHFLAYKTQGILHVKLLEMINEPKKRTFHQEMAKKYLLQALEENQKDGGLYRLLISLNTNQEGQNSLEYYVNLMIDRGVVIPRHDILPYVVQLIRNEQLDLAQKMIDQSKKQYEFSRALIEAQKYLDRQKELKREG